MLPRPTFLGLPVLPRQAGNLGRLYSRRTTCRLVFFLTDPAPTEIYTLSLHDALPISSLVIAAAESPQRNTTSAATSSGFTNRFFGCFSPSSSAVASAWSTPNCRIFAATCFWASGVRSEEHTFELQSRQYLVCRLLLEK